MKLINLPLNQQKTITTRKIMKLRKIKKIKKRKIRKSKTSIVNLDHDIKREEDKAKKNESNSSENSIQPIIQRSSPLSEEISLYTSRSDEPNTNINDNNINTQTNNIRLDDRFSTQNKILSPYIYHRPRPLLEIPDLNLFYFNRSSDISSEDELESESEILNSRPTLFPVEVNNNRSDLIIENPNNNGSNIPLNNINNSNGNEFNLQNNNANNNNQNNIHFHLGVDRTNRRLRILRNRERRQREREERERERQRARERRERRQRRKRIAIINIKNKLTQIRFRESLYSEGSNEKCIICFEDFKSEQNVYKLSCHHLFHVDCLDKEIEYRQKCPLCRKKL